MSVSLSSSAISCDNIRLTFGAKQMTVAIGDEIRDSSALAEKMNEGFDHTRLRLGRTMNRMLVMAEKTGVGWRVWLAFFLYLPYAISM